jgi:GTP cyclohydrolase I
MTIEGPELTGIPPARTEEGDGVVMESSNKGCWNASVFGQYLVSRLTFDRWTSSGALVFVDWLRQHRDVPDPIDKDAVAAAVEAFLAALGKEATGALAQTPELVAQAWCEELLDGEGIDVTALLKRESIQAPPSPTTVALRGLSVSSMCPHHLLPSHGTADVVYLPGERIAGFGAIAKALRALTRRLTLQEEAGQAMSDALVAGLGARGAICRLRLVHTCLVTRGARETGAEVETLSFGGSFAEPGPERDLGLAALMGGGGVSHGR